MKKYQKLLMAVASGLLLWVSWPVRGCAALIFIALVPLFYIEERISKGEKGHIFWLSFTHTQRCQRNLHISPKGSFRDLAFVIKLGPFPSYLAGAG